MAILSALCFLFIAHQERHPCTQRAQCNADNELNRMNGGQRIDGVQNAKRRGYNQADDGGKGLAGDILE